MAQEKQISEFDDATDFAETSILHTKEISDNSDRKVIVQDVLDLVPDQSGSIVPEDGVAYDDGADELVFSDDSLGGVIRRLPASVILTAAGSAVTSGNVVANHYKIGQLEFRWGSVTSTIDGPESFNFSSAFTTSCEVVIVQRSQGSGNDGYAVTAKTVSSFTADRSDDIGGSDPFDYLAIGY